MAQRVRSIHGHFITVEQKAIEDAERAAKLQWKAPEPVHTFENGYKLVSLRATEDLVKFGEEMRHCAGSHVKWVQVERIWHILTTLDEKGEAHGTLFLKDNDWFKKPHPDDARSTGGIYVGKKTDCSVFALSTIYDYTHYEPVMFQGKVCQVLELSGKYHDPNDKSAGLLEQWVKENRVEIS